MRARHGQGGLIRGCCLLVALLVVLLGGGAFLADRALAAPDLGAQPRGPDHGETQTAIAVALGMQLAAELAVQPHGTVTLSEHDLTVLVAAHNPNPSSYTALAARVRNHLVVISGQHALGPFTFTPVARVGIAFNGSASPPTLGTQVMEIDVGQLELPGPIRDRILGGFGTALDLNRLFGGSPALQAARADIECIVVAGDGVRIGVHGPGVTPDPAVCGG